jgi:hypothetical protein
MTVIQFISEVLNGSKRLWTSTSKMTSVIVVRHSRIVIWPSERQGIVDMHYRIQLFTPSQGR